MAAREYTNSSFEFHEYRQDGSCIFQQQQQQQQRARGSKLFSLLDADGSSFFFFFITFLFARHVRGAYSIRKERGFRDSRFFSLTLDSPLPFRQLTRACHRDSTVFACVSRFLLSFFPQTEAGVRQNG